MNIHRELAYISLWFSLPGNFFKGKIYKSQEKEVNIIIYERKIILGIREYFANTSHLMNIIFTNYSFSYSYRSWIRKSIPIPIFKKNNYSLITVLVLKYPQIFISEKT